MNYVVICDCYCSLFRGGEISRNVLLELKKNHGFIPNFSRGTGYLFKWVLFWMCVCTCMCLYTCDVCVHIYESICVNVRTCVFIHVWCVCYVCMCSTCNVDTMFMFLLSGEALEQFLHRNNLSHVIRAHEVKATGFQVCTYIHTVHMCCMLTVCLDTYVCVCVYNMYCTWCLYFSYSK